MSFASDLHLILAQLCYRYNECPSFKALFHTMCFLRYFKTGNNTHLLVSVSGSSLHYDTKFLTYDYHSVSHWLFFLLFIQIIINYLSNNLRLFRWEQVTADLRSMNFVQDFTSRCSSFRNVFVFPLNSFNVCKNNSISIIFTPPIRKNNQNTQTTCRGVCLLLIF